MLAWSNEMIQTELKMARDALQSVIDIFSTLPNRRTSVRRRKRKKSSHAGHAKRRIAKAQNRQ
jgi:hypothetical protein